VEGARQPAVQRSRCRPADTVWWGADRTRTQTESPPTLSKQHATVVVLDDEARLSARQLRGCWRTRRHFQSAAAAQLASSEE